MNGFGQDPFRLYSFQAPQNIPTIARMELPKQAMAGLRSSRAYLQAGGEGRQRMETLVGMGLPAQTDISKVRAEGMGAGGVPRFSAPRPLPFGSYDGFGMTEEQRRQREAAAAQRQAARIAPAGGPQPAQGTSIPPVVPERSLGISSETPLSFTGFGRATGESAYRTPTIPQTVPSPLPRGTTETLTSFSGIPRFPFAGY